MPRVESVCAIVAFTVAALIAPTVARAGTCYVGTTGNDASTAPSNPKKPLATIAEALHRGSAACNPIVFLDGTYNQRIIITSRNEPAGTPLVITAENPYSPSQPTVGAFIDGGLAPVEVSLPRQAAVGIYDSSYITIKGLHIRQDASQFCPVVAPSSSLCHSTGIEVRDLLSVINGPSSHHIDIVENEVAYVKAATALGKTDDGECFSALKTCNGGAGCSRHYDAVAIQVYSSRDGVNAAGQSDPTEATNHITVRGNDVHDNDLNSDCNENPVMNVSTNVEHVLIEDNTIHNITPSSTAHPSTPGITVRGELYGTEFNDIVQATRRARKVVVRHNTFNGITGIGIYVQSANNVLIERNQIRSTGYGVQIATEGNLAGAGTVAAAQSTRGRQVWVRDNLLTTTELWPIDIGKPASSWSPVDDVFATNNSILEAPTSPPSVVRWQALIRPGVGGDSRFANNLIRLSWPSQSTCVPAMNGQNACDFLLSRDTSNTTTAVDYNLWYVANYPSNPPTPLVFCTTTAGTQSCQSFAPYKLQYEPNAVGSDPQIAVEHLATTSPARNAGVVVAPSWVTAVGSNPLGNFGDYAAASSPELDYYGNPRVVGNTIDIGMEELQ